MKQAQKEISEMAPTKRSAIKTIYKTFQLLKDNKGELPRKQIIDYLSENNEFEPWELERYESNGQLKWLTIFLFYTIDCIKAGWLVKNKGIWYLTPEGMNAANLDEMSLFSQANKAYKDWSLSEGKNSLKDNSEVKELDLNNEKVQQVTIEELQSQADDGIGKYLETIPEYNFQKLAGLLIKSMGYFIDFEAPPGPDGGIDLIAYKDPLGFEKPRIKIQVKRYNEKNKIDVKAIRELKGLLNINEHIGIFITSGNFTKEAENFARHSDIHIMLIDRRKFIELWKEHSYKLTDEEKMLLPLHPIYFLGKVE